MRQVLGLCAVGLAFFASTVDAQSSRGNFALGFRGGQLAGIADNPGFDGIESSDVVTIEAWIMIHRFVNGWFSITDKYERSTDFGWIFQVEDGSVSGVPNIQFLGGIGPNARAPWVAPLDLWTHVAVTYDRGPAIARFYVNGSLIGSQRYAADIQSTRGEPLFLGYNPSGGDEWDVGAIDDVRIWNLVRTSAEIEEHYLGEDLPDDATNPFLVGHWKLNEGFGPFFADSSLFNNDGQLGSGRSMPKWVRREQRLVRFDRELEPAMPFLAWPFGAPEDSSDPKGTLSRLSATNPGSPVHRRRLSVC